MERSLLYVSKRTSLLTAPQDLELKEIVDVAVERNMTLGVTGALIATKTSFAQHIEGHQVAINDLMDSIRRDRRHFDILVLDYKYITHRRFPEWAMAYAGPSSYVTNLVEGLMEQDSAFDTARIKQLVRIMEAFSAEILFKQ